MHTLRAPLFGFVLSACLGLGAMAAGAARAQVPGPPYPTAHCSDGTYYYGKSRAKACLHHRGIAEWLARPPAATSRGARSGSRRSAARVPAGATARCKDGSWSFIQRRAAACSRHGGVVRWLGSR